MIPAQNAATRYLNFGKQIRKDGAHFADVSSDLAAAAICNALNAPAPAASEGQEVELAKRLRAVAGEMRRENPGRLGEHPVMPHEGDLERAAAMLEAAALARAGDGWRGIESVPTQGPPQQIVALWDADEPMLVNAPFFMHRGRLTTFSVESSNMRDASRLTHWMPLRPLPAASDVGEG